MKKTNLVVAAALASLLACADDAAPPKPPIAPPQPSVASSVVPPNASGDPLGDKPVLAAPKPFDPPAPEVFKTANGMSVWLVERHTLPMVSATIVVPHGSAADPKDKTGLASITADMLDEGAGKRSAVELSSAVNDLGASLGTGATADGSQASLVVLKKNFRAAFDILADVVARPRFEAKEWKRVSELWRNDLKKRADDPEDVARVVGAALVFGHDAPYGHPVDGWLATAKNVDLAAVKAFYKSHWRPDQATLVVAGDVTRAEIEDAVKSSLGAWSSSGEKIAVVTPAAPASARPRVVLVDRADAPQSVIAIVRDAPSASDPRLPLLGLVNTALGGSFTSRLNQNLREDHGYTYGSASRFSQTRGPGSFRAVAAVRTDVTGPALDEMIGEVDKLVAKGLSEAELAKVKAQDRADLVQDYEKISGLDHRLASLAVLGLPPTFDVQATRARQHATLAEVNALLPSFDRASATILVVGPKKDVLPQLQKAGLPAPELWDAEGNALRN